MTELLGHLSPRVGWGFDAHRLDGEPPLKLGGVVVSETAGVTATSDGDVLVHALIDALLGAAVLGDIGQHFPSDDASSQGADSMGLLRQTVRLTAEAGLVVAHVDVTVVAENVPIGPHRESIRENLGDALALSPSLVSVKATTTDGLGLIGRGEGVAAMAVATMSAAPRPA